jgi:hypothetical protein
MSKRLITSFLCIVFSFSVTLAGQQGNPSKSDSSSKAADKNSTTYSPSAAAKTQFMRETGYRNGRPGYVVAYRKPLACGGTDDTSNLLWLTIAEAKAKEKAERKGCK